MKPKRTIFKGISLFIGVCFFVQAIFPSFSFAQELLLPKPTEFVYLSSSYSFPVLKGMKFDPADPLKMEFIIDTGDDRIVTQDEASKLVKYFLAGLTIPEEDLWVNMSPYEEDKIIPERLAETDLGKDLLAQDYILKQLSSSLVYPESDTGKDYWQKVYEELLKVAKTTKLPVNTFNKIWITPEKAVVYENESSCLITEASLKVMLEEDYLTLSQNPKTELQNSLSPTLNQEIHKASSQVMRDTILPKITQDVNYGKNFSNLRQIYHSLILACWFKKKFKESLYKYYIDQNKIKGIDLEDKAVKEKIYSLYTQAFKNGLYNYIKTESEPKTKKRIKRQYFGGGVGCTNLATRIEKISLPVDLNFKEGSMAGATTVLDPFTGRLAASPISYKWKKPSNVDIKKVLKEEINKEFALGTVEITKGAWELDRKITVWVSKTSGEPSPTLSFYFKVGEEEVIARVDCMIGDEKWLFIILRSYFPWIREQVFHLAITLVLEEISPVESGKPIMTSEVKMSLNPAAYGESHAISITDYAINPLLEEYGFQYGEHEAGEGRVMMAWKLLSPEIAREILNRAPNRASSAVTKEKEQFLKDLSGIIKVTPDGIKVLDRTRFLEEGVDTLAYAAALSEDPDVKMAARHILYEVAPKFGLKIASVEPFYMDKLQEKWRNYTVPAINVRLDAFRQARVIMKVAKELNAFWIPELAKSETSYTDQDADEYVAVMLAAAIKEGYTGFLCVQRDHLQVNKEKFNKGGAEREKELKAVEEMIHRDLLAGKFNIDLDCSTLINEEVLDRIVELETNLVNEYLRKHPELVTEELKSNPKAMQTFRHQLVDEIERGDISDKEFLEQKEIAEIIRELREKLYPEMQKENIEISMRFIRHIRKLEKELNLPYSVSIGVEERHIDTPKHKDNPSTVLGSITLMKNILTTCEKEGLKGPAKISLQTGTMHGLGGEVDFGIYERHSRHKKEIGVGVFAQHGASRLSEEEFDKMRIGNVGEVHLATEYQATELSTVAISSKEHAGKMLALLNEFITNDPKLKKKYEELLEKALAQESSIKSKQDIIVDIVGDSSDLGDLKGKFKDLVKFLSKPLKEDLWNLPENIGKLVETALEQKFRTIFKKLGATNSKELIEESMLHKDSPVFIPPRPEAMKAVFSASSSLRKIKAASSTARGGIDLGGVEGIVGIQFTSSPLTLSPEWEERFKTSFYGFRIDRFEINPLESSEIHQFFGIPLPLSLKTE